MQTDSFRVIGEKIHCTRIFKTQGARVRRREDGSHALTYRRAGEARELPVPGDVVQGAEWAAGKVRHCALAARQFLHGDATASAAGADYLQALAEEQAAAGAHYLDVNVDEYSGDPAERVEVMRRVAALVQEATPLPLSIDSSHPDTLRAGLEACDRSRGRPLLNSVSLERLGALDLLAEADAAAIVSAAGEKTMPRTVEERLDNLRDIIARLRAVGRPDASFFIDPLVFPVATDGANGASFIEAVAAVRVAFGLEVHITGGFSNVSFGLPNRNLINVVFTWLAVDAGADSGIVDPAHINGKILAEVDPSSEGFRLARALLMNEDAFGEAFIAASREGRI